MPIKNELTIFPGLVFPIILYHPSASFNHPSWFINSKGLQSATSTLYFVLVTSEVCWSQWLQVLAGARAEQNSFSRRLQGNAYSMTANFGPQFRNLRGLLHVSYSHQESARPLNSRLSMIIPVYLAGLVPQSYRESLDIRHWMSQPGSRGT